MAADWPVTDGPRRKQARLVKEKARQHAPGCSDHSWVCNTAILRSYVNRDLGLNVDIYPEFFSKAGADWIFQQLETELKTYLDGSKSQVKIMGKVCSIPRKQTAFGDKGLTYSFSGTTISANEWIPLVSRIKKHVEAGVGETFNFVLVNRYKDGLDHIGEHRDDESDLRPGASIASLSFGQERDLVFRHKDSRGRNACRKDIQSMKLSLRHGSLLVMKYPTNTVWYHSLPVRRKATGPRINLTFRQMR